MHGITFVLEMNATVLRHVLSLQHSIASIHCTYTPLRGACQVTYLTCFEALDHAESFH